MVADVTETRNVIPGLEFKTWTTKKCKNWFWNIIFVAESSSEDGCRCDRNT